MTRWFRRKQAAEKARWARRTRHWKNRPNPLIVQPVFSTQFFPCYVSIWGPKSEAESDEFLAYKRARRLEKIAAEEAEAKAALAEERAKKQQAKEGRPSEGR